MRVNIPRRNTNTTELGLVTKLNQLLSSYQVLRQTLYNFHWNIEGQNFFDLHAHFGGLYEDVEGKIDILAEQVRILGGFPLSKMSDYISNSIISEAEVTTVDTEMVNKVKGDYQSIIGLMTAMFNDGLDPGTENIIQTFLEHEGKKVWMLRSFLK